VDTDPLPRDLILLAHWEAQSYWQENYTDLYDFCFRLSSKRNNIKPASAETTLILKDIWDASDEVMRVLKRGVPDNDNEVIVRCEFAGPAYQYSHGLSIFFPWSEPVGDRMWDEQYGQYKLNKRTDWRKFLTVYFDKTKRASHGEEIDVLDQPLTDPSLDRNLLELLQTITTRVFNDDGQLKGGPGDTIGPGKGGSIDPTGSDCECGSIKNYPSFTLARREKEAKDKPLEGGKVPVSPNFFRRFRSEIESP
jgi:hypothetical protein